MTENALPTTTAALGVNGPEDVGSTGKPSIGGPGGQRTAATAEDLKATRDGDLKKVRNLQKLMLRSRTTRWSACGR